MPVPIIWSQHADACLLHLRAHGLPWKAVAAELRVGRNAVIERSRRLGLRPVTHIQPLPRPVVARIDRSALPPGHPVTWQAITTQTTLEGEPYPYPVFS